MYTLVGTGFLVLGAVVWIVCAVYAYQNAPKFGRSAGLWTVLCDHLRAARPDGPVRTPEAPSGRRSGVKQAQGPAGLAIRGSQEAPLTMGRGSGPLATLTGGVVAHEQHRGIAAMHLVVPEPALQEVPPGDPQRTGRDGAVPVTRTPHERSSRVAGPGTADAGRSERARTRGAA